MPVIMTRRLILRGVIRAQTKYAVFVTNRLVQAYLKNPDLQLFSGVLGPNSTAQMQAQIAFWKTTLAARSL